MVVFFFFSSRRRHTRCSRDWSSDVCSSDLVTREYRGADFFVRDAGRLFATPLFVVLLVVEITDVTLAIDSIPAVFGITRSEEHTSELQSRLHLVCRLLLEKKKNTHIPNHYT